MKARFEAKVRKTATCWEWTANLDKDGYGQIWVDKQRRRARAPRVAWELYIGPIPPKQCVLHHCDNPKCVRPSHLFLGSVCDNNQDRARKGRSAVNIYPLPGERNPHAKLTNRQAQEIRFKYQTGLTQTALAAQYGLSQVAVSRVVRGVAYR